MLFRFSDIEGRASEVLGAWLSQSEQLHDARALYFSGVYGRGFIEGKLLALTQAAEAFHRRFYPGLYMDEEAFETNVFQPLKKAMPSSIDEALRAATHFSPQLCQRILPTSPHAGSLCRTQRSPARLGSRT